MYLELLNDWPFLTATSVGIPEQVLDIFHLAAVGQVLAGKGRPIRRVLAPVAVLDPAGLGEQFAGVEGSEIS